MVVVVVVMVTVTAVVMTGVVMLGLSRPSDQFQPPCLNGGTSLVKRQ